MVDIYWCMLFVLFYCDRAHACAWATPEALLPVDLVRGLNQGLDHSGKWIIQAIFVAERAKKGFIYEVIKVSPESVKIDTTIATHGNNAILAHKVHTPTENSDQHLSHQNIFEITIGVKCNNKKIAQALYNIKMTGSYDFNHYYNNSGNAVETEDGWKSNSTLVFFPDINHYSQVNVSKQLDCQYIYVNSSLKMLTNQNNTCQPNGGCLAIAEIDLVRKMNCQADDHWNHSRVLTGISVSYAVSQIIQMGENRTLTNYPTDFNVSRRTPVHYGSDHRYDICQAKKCNIQTNNCTDNLSKNQRLMDDLQIHIQQNATADIDHIKASCAFEPFSFVDGIGSPFIFVQTWFKYDSGEPAPNSTWRANAHDGWWCPPTIREKLQKVGSTVQVRRRLQIPTYNADQNQRGRKSYTNVHAETYP